MASRGRSGERGSLMALAAILPCCSASKSIVLPLANCMSGAQAAPLHAHIQAHGHVGVCGICNRMWWLKAVQQQVWHHNHAGPMVYVNVGVNKGYNVAAMARIFANASFTGKDWLQKMRAHMQAHRFKGFSWRPLDCGNCKDCNEVYAPLATRSLQIHAFDVVPELVQWVREASRTFGLTDVTVVHAAVSHEPGVLYVPPALFGSETTQTQSTDVVGVAEMDRRQPSKLLPVNATTLDAYAEAASLKRIHLVSIDAELHDGEVIEGMKGLLERHSVDVVEFEYQSPFAGRWTRSLQETLDLFDTRGYGCFWQCERVLVPISGQCFRPPFVNASGNIVCAHGRSMAALLASPSRYP